MKNKFINWITKAATRQINEVAYGIMMGRMGVMAPNWMGISPEKLINKGYAYNATVYSIVNLIIRAAIRVPWQVYRVKDDKSLAKYKAARAEDLTIKTIMRTKALEEASDHKIMEIWARPNPNQGTTEWISQNIGFKLTTGNSYTFGAGPDTGGDAGQFHELYNLPSQIIKIRTGGMAQPIKGYTSSMDPELLIPPEQILHRKYWTPLYASGAFLYGLSPIQAGSKVITRSNDAYQTSVAQLQNQGARGILVGDMPPGGAQLTQDQALNLKEKYYEDYGGPDNAGKIVITGARMRWEQMGLSPIDLQLLEGEKMDIRSICNLYGIQSQLLNDPENKTYANQKDAMKSLFTNAALPELDDMRDELNRWWIPAFQKGGEKLFFDYDVSVIPELQEEIEKLVTRLATAWWLSPNERRVAMGYDVSEMKDADDIWIPSGLAPMSDSIIPGEEL